MASRSHARSTFFQNLAKRGAKYLSEILEICEAAVNQRRRADEGEFRIREYCMRIGDKIFKDIEVGSFEAVKG